LVAFDVEIHKGNFIPFFCTANEYAEKITWKAKLKITLPKISPVVLNSNVSVSLMRFCLFLICLLWAFGQTAHSQWRAPKYSNEFLSIGAGARGLSMGGAQTSCVDDVHAGFWNPAGLGLMKGKTQFALMHASYFAGIANYDFASAAFRVDSQSVLGISWLRFAVDDIPDTRYLIDNGQVDYRRIQSFSSADNAVFFSYGRKISAIPGLSLGGNLKIIYRKAGNFANAWGFGLDAGLRYRLKNWDLGLYARDVSGTFNAWSYNTSEFETVFAQTGNAIPLRSVEVTIPSLSLGVSRKFDLWKNRLGLRPVLDLFNSFDGKRNTLVSSKLMSIDPRIGLEVSFFDLVSLRSGIANIQRIRDFSGKENLNYQLNFGLGLHWKVLSLDYAITDLGDNSEALYSHIFSLKAAF